jgi:hypothetical protein
MRGQNTFAPPRMCEKIPFMVPFDIAQGRLAHHERDCISGNHSTSPFVLRPSQGDRLIFHTL